MTQDGRRGTAVDEVRDLLLAELGQYAAGDRIGTEAEYSARWGVSRSTVREALKTLEQTGVLRAVRGHGRFLSAAGSLTVDRPISRYESITDLLEERGLTVTALVLDVELSTAGSAEAQELRCPVGTEVIRLSRVRYGDDAPMVVSFNVILRDALPGPIDHRDWSGSLGSALRVNGSPVVSSAARISAVADLPETVRIRELARLGPWLLVEETGITAGGIRVLLSADYHRHDEFAFRVLRGA